MAPATEISFQRTRSVPLRSPLNRRPLSGRSSASFVRSLSTSLGTAIALLCSLACQASASAASGKVMNDALACRGWMTVKLHPRELRRVQGTTFVDWDPAEPLPTVRVILIDERFAERVYIAVSDSAGHFSFDHVPSGTYTLKTCLDGFNMLEFLVTVSSSGATEPLVLRISLST